jgi:hypothetical protein
MKKAPPKRGQAAPWNTAETIGVRDGSSGAARFLVADSPGVSFEKDAAQIVAASRYSRGQFKGTRPAMRDIVP